MAKRTPQSALGAPQLKRLVPLLLDWFAANARDLPWRRTHDPYAIWVSEIMLQQTQVKTVIPYWERWMHEVPTIEAAAKVRPAKIHKLWEGLGYYTRVRNLQKAAKQILVKHDGKFPRNFDDVLALPGIGRYTAGAICSIAFNQPWPILDGNVIRVLTRIFGIAQNPGESETTTRLWRLAEELVITACELSSSRSSRREEAPSSKSKIGQSLLTSATTFAGNCSALNQSLMELGARVCTPRNPQCQICPVKNLCTAFQDGRVEQLPNFGRRTSTTARRFVAFVVERKGIFLVRQRPAGGVNAHLWEFPNVEVNGANLSAKDIFKSEFGLTPSELSPLSIIRHSITRYRITLEVFRARLGMTRPKSSRPRRSKLRTRVTRPSEVGVWKTPAQMQALAFTSAHRRILRTVIDAG